MLNYADTERPTKPIPEINQMTKAKYEKLSIGTILHHKTLKNADSTPLNARVNGKIKTWKTRPTEFRLPMKYGLRQCFYITETNAFEWELPSN